MCEGFVLCSAKKHSFSKNGAKLILSVRLLVVNQTYLKIEKSKSEERKSTSKF